MSDKQPKFGPGIINRDVEGRFFPKPVDYEKQWTLLSQPAADVEGLTVKLGKMYPMFRGSLVKAAMYRDGREVIHSLEVVLPDMVSPYYAEYGGFELRFSDLGDLDGALEHVGLLKHLVSASTQLASGDKEAYLDLIERMSLPDDSDQD